MYQLKELKSNFMCIFKLGIFITIISFNTFEFSFDPSNKINPSNYLFEVIKTIYFFLVKNILYL